MPTLPSNLLDALDGGELVLTPTALAAAELRAGHDDRRRASRLAVWQPAQVFSWQQWLRSLWSGLLVSGRESRLLLSQSQEELLWREIVLASLDPASVASAPSFGKLAASAYALAGAYNVTARLAEAANTADTEQFAAWAQEFTRTCARHGYLAAAHLGSALREQLDLGALPIPDTLHLFGFLESAPADAAFLQAVRDAGACVLTHELAPAEPVGLLVLRADNDRDELQQVARWLRGLLDDHIADSLAHSLGDHTATTAAVSLPLVHVVLAGAKPDFVALDSIFREALAPELDQVAADPSSAPWEVSAGRPLAAQPCIATLLRVLRGLLNPLTAAGVTALILSPHLGGPGTPRDRDTPAQFDAWTLREHPPLRPEMTFREMAAMARHSPFGTSTLGWLEPLLKLLDGGPDRDARQTHADWAAFIRQVAVAVGWPGEQPLPPLALAATEAWDRLLDALATLDFTGRHVTFEEAFASLGQQTDAAAVSLNTRPCIRVLSAAEAAVIPCDVLVLARATEGNWPPAARAHPLLPWSVQASAGMPGTDPDRDAARAGLLTDALLHTTPHVLFSYAAEANDAPQRLAPSLARRTAGSPWAELSHRHAAAAPEIPLEQIVDDSPLPPLPGPEVSGGARVLQMQADCGFRAFAEIRLRSTEPRTADLGMDAGRAGGLLHRALEIFWRKVESQAELRSLTGEQMDDEIAGAVEQAFGDGYFPAAQDAWGKAYRALQMQRLFSLLRDWLAIEKERAPFTVLGQEEKRRLTVGPLELHLRVDRIDAVEDGSGTVLIDYKTGANARPSAWTSDRPEEPQLPLYTLLPNPAALRGLAFARVRRGELSWAGVQAAPGLLGSAHVDQHLDSLVAAWRDVLTRLAEQFAAGDHSVNPRSFPKTCTYCGQRFLCRLDPETLLDSSASFDEEDRAAVAEDLPRG